MKQPIIGITADSEEPGGYSDRVSNAMFLAAGPQTSAKAFQAFVQDLWGHQEPRGSKGPSDTEIADMARETTKQALRDWFFRDERKGGAGPAG